MNKGLGIAIGIAGGLIVLGGVAYGGWYAWDQGVLPGNPRAPTVQAMEPTLKRHAGPLLESRAAGLCIGPDVGRVQPEVQGRPGIASRPLPGQHAVTFLLEGAPQSQDLRERMLKQYNFFARQGFFTEAEVSVDTDAGARPGREYRMTWKGFAALGQGYGQCFAAGKRRYAGVEKIERQEDAFGIQVWKVTFRTEAEQVPEWAQAAEARTLFPKLAEAAAPRSESARLLRGNEAWLTEQEMQVQLHLAKLRASGQDVSHLVHQLARGTVSAEPALEPATAQKLFEEYLASEQWQARSQAVCVPLQLQRGGDDRQAGAFDRTSFSVTWRDAPAGIRRDYERNAMLTQLHLLSALEHAGLASMEKAAAGMVNGQSVAVGYKFTVRPEALETLGLTGGACMPVGRFGKIEFLGARASARSMRVAARAEVTLVQPWARSLAEHLPALKAILEEGVPFSGQMDFGPGYDPRTGAPAEAKWRVSSLSPNYPHVAATALPGSLQPLYPQTHEASLKRVKAPATLPAVIGAVPPVAPPAATLPPRPAAVPSPAPQPTGPAARAVAPPYPAAGAEVHVISVYEGELPGGKARGFREHPEGTINVVVGPTAKPVFLLLSAYEPIEWKVTASGGARLQRVIAIGYHEQRVTISGGKGIPVLTRKEREFFADARISAGEGLPREAARGNKAIQAAEIVQALTGERPASYQGEYRGKGFVVDTSSPRVTLPERKAAATLGPGTVTLTGPWPESTRGLRVDYGRAGAYSEAWATRAYSAGKVYFEATIAVDGGGNAKPHANVGVAQINGREIEHSPEGTTAAIAHGEQKIYRDGDVFGVAVDYDAGVMYVRVNGQWITGEPGSGLGKRFRPGRERAAYLYATGGGHGGGEKLGSVSWVANFGASAFGNAPPQGYVAYDGSRR